MAVATAGSESAVAAATAASATTLRAATSGRSTRTGDAGYAQQQHGQHRAGGVGEQTPTAAGIALCQATERASTDRGTPPPRAPAPRVAAAIPHLLEGQHEQDGGGEHEQQEGPGQQRAAQRRDDHPAAGSGQPGSAVDVAVDVVRESRAGAAPRPRPAGRPPRVRLRREVRSRRRLRHRRLLERARRWAATRTGYSAAHQGSAQHGAHPRSPPGPGRRGQPAGRAAGRALARGQGDLRPG